MSVIGYLLSGNATIIHVMPPDAWRAFAVENGAHAIADPASVIGRPLSAFIDGEQTRLTVETMPGLLHAGLRPRLSYLYRCDAPEVRRFMRMELEPTGSGDVLATSTVLREEPRVAPLIFGGLPEQATELPVQRICSYCKRLAQAGEGAEWLEAEAYEAAGGAIAVRLSHGVCPECTAYLLAASEGLA